MKATITTKVIRCQGRKFDGYSFSVSVNLGDIELLYLTTAEDQAISSDCLSSATWSNPYINYDYNKESGTFKRVNGDRYDVDRLNSLAVSCEGLPIIYPQIPEGMQAAETVTNTYEHIIDTCADLPIVLSVFLTNLGQYNAGALVGEWINLPAIDSKLDECMKRIGIGTIFDEYFISDWESPFTGLTEICGEYSSIYGLNEIAKDIAELEEYEIEALGVLLDGGYDDLDGCLKVIRSHDYFMYNADTLEDVAREIIEESGTLDRIPEDLQGYFDYQMYARDLKCSGNFYTGDGVYIEVIA